MKTKNKNTFRFVEQSNWRMLFFGHDGIVWTPEQGKVPNCWYRFWSRVFFNCKWEKIK